MEPIDDSAFEDDEDYEETQTQTQTADKKPVQQAEQPTVLGEKVKVFTCICIFTR